jgi:hypothetical protein
MIMPINKSRAQKLAQAALDHLKETNPDELKRARDMGPATFHNLRLKHFLADYCWVVYASGFKFAIIEAKFPALRSAFKDFEPAALSRMRSIRPVLDVFNNERKAKSFLTGAQTIIRDGFIPFKQRLRQEGAQALETLPGIGPITKDHLAKNIGLADVPKCPSEDFLIPLNQLDSMEPILIRGGASIVDGQEPGEVRPRSLEISERPD